MERPKTPPQRSRGDFDPLTPATPEHVKQLENNRLKAKSLRTQQERESARNQSNEAPLRQLRAGSSNLSNPAQKRPFSAMTNAAPSSVRDGRIAAAGTSTNTTAPQQSGPRPLEDIQPARNFARYVEYDFSKMTDTKGGFLTQEDDPHNKALKSRNEEDKPAHMTMKEWERLQLLRSLKQQKTGPFEPGISALQRGAEQKKCEECGNLEIDWKWEEVLHCAVCNKCKEDFPDKYSLLTKTEAKEDYLLTDPELRDEELLPHLERPNPHKSTWNNMMLYLRYQVEEYAFSDRKWGSPEALDIEFEKREGVKKKRKEDKFKSRLNDLKKRTRVEAWRRARQKQEEEGGEAQFGDDMGKGGKHTHYWSQTLGNGADQAGVKRCVDCGMEVEELQF